MPLTIYNTLTNEQQRFVPLSDDAVTMYTCGPTVYDFAHIGNFRTFLAADVLRRYLESPICTRVLASGAPCPDRLGKRELNGGYAVKHVMNITDVGHMTDDSYADGDGEDKMQAATKRLLENKKAGTLPDGAPEEFDPESPWDIARFYAEAFTQDARSLGIRVAIEAADDASCMPAATGAIAPMLALIAKLIDKGHAYIASDGVCYFDVQSFPDYGQLSGNTLDRIRSGAGGRVEETTQSIKKHPADFMLWKPDASHVMKWDPIERSPDDATRSILKESGLGVGYPGWHIECSAMAGRAFGDVLDIHTGGEDLIFPHHECEIAQSRAALGTSAFARFWVHTRFLQVEGEKMSKSKGNFFTLRDLLAKGHAPGAVRLELVKTHYRANANFTDQGLKDASKMLERWRAFTEKGEASSEQGSADAQAVDDFAHAMDDDLNTAGAIGAINSFIKRTSEPSRSDASLMHAFDAVLGVLDLEQADAGVDIDAEQRARIDALVTARTEARAAKDWGRADQIRDELNELKVVVTDTPDGPTWAIDR